MQYFSIWWPWIVTLTLERAFAPHSIPRYYLCFLLIPIFFVVVGCLPCNRIWLYNSCWISYACQLYPYVRWTLPLLFLAPRLARGVGRRLVSGADAAAAIWRSGSRRMPRAFHSDELPPLSTSNSYLYHLLILLSLPTKIRYPLHIQVLFDPFVHNQRWSEVLFILLRDRPSSNWLLAHPAVVPLSREGWGLDSGFAKLGPWDPWDTEAFIQIENN